MFVMPFLLRSHTLILGYNFNAIYTARDYLVNFYYTNAYEKGDKMYVYCIVGIEVTIR